MTQHIAFLLEFNKYFSQITNIFSIHIGHLFKQYSYSILLSNIGFGFKKTLFHLRINLTFSKMFSMTPSVIFKSDILRYFVIYESDGVYIDMDFKAYAPLDPLLKNYSCILGREPDPIAYSSRGRQYLISNAFFALQRPNQFLRLITERFRAKTSFWRNVLTETGPDFMTDHLVEFAVLFQHPTSSIITKPLFTSVKAVFISFGIG